MEIRYQKMAKAFKALSDPPTLAHDMKVLTDAELVVSRREGKRTMYSLNWTTLKRMNKIMENLVAQCDTQDKK